MTCGIVAAAATYEFYETFTASSGLISSPNYPQPYPPNAVNFYRILAPSSATIKLQFLDFNVFAWPSDYYGDQLEVCVTILYTLPRRGEFFMEGWGGRRNVETCGESVHIARVDDVPYVARTCTTAAAAEAAEAERLN